MTFFITLGHRNSIQLNECKENQLHAVHALPPNVRIPGHLGKSMWSYEKIVSVLNQSLSTPPPTT